MHNVNKRLSTIILFMLVVPTFSGVCAPIDFSNVDAARFKFPANFLFGVTSNHKSIVTPTVDHNELSMTKQLGVSSFNFVLDWAAIEPREGQFDVDQLDRITKKCKALNDAGIKPAVYLLNSEMPSWFNAKGGFEHTSNIGHFVRYCQKMFACLHDDVHLWLTFYQPAAFALERYFRGNQPPHKKDMQLSLVVLKNLLEAHIQVYEAIKGVKHNNGTRVGAMVGGAHAQIGISHHVYWLEPYCVVSPFDLIGAAVGNRLNNKLVIDFFRTGRLKFTLPFLGKQFLWSARIDYINTRASDSLDFIGLIYHSHCYMKNFKTVSNPQETPTDLDIFTIYPEGLYNAIKFVSQLKKPIHIINGIADAQDKHREFFIKRHLYVVSHAIAQGYDVRSYFYRMLHGASDEKHDFGLYSQNKDGAFTLRKSASYLTNVIADHKRKYNR